jgi:regulator of RNase E activity RraA
MWGLSSYLNGSPVHCDHQPPTTTPNEEEDTNGDRQSQVVQRLLALRSTAAVADADKQGLRVRVMDRRLRWMASNGTSSRERTAAFAGVARTVRTLNDNLPPLEGVLSSGAGEVLVIDTQSSTVATVGELCARECLRRGVQAIVIDGPCRDVRQLAELDIPIFATATCPASGACSLTHQTQQIKVSCGGVTVQPGDIVYGDEDGIVVATLQHMEEVLPTAEAVVAAEELVLEGLVVGVGLREQLNFDEHLASLITGEEGSKLRFCGQGSGAAASPPQ